jgi:hypothetical protein
MTFLLITQRKMARKQGRKDARKDARTHTAMKEAKLLPEQGTLCPFFLCLHTPYSLQEAIWNASPVLRYPDSLCLLTPTDRL